MPAKDTESLGIKSTDSLNSLLLSSSNYFFLDIEETILLPNTYYEALAHRYFVNIFSELVREHGSGLSVKEIASVGKNFKRRLTERSIPEVVVSLQQKKKQVYTLSSGVFLPEKKDRLEELGLHFNGLLFTSGFEKGPYLANFIERNNISVSECCFVDNHLAKILSVQKYCNKGNTCLVECFLYKRETFPYVSTNRFTHYWKSVIVYLQNKKFKQQRASR